MDYVSNALLLRIPPNPSELWHTVVDADTMSRLYLRHVQL